MLNYFIGYWSLRQHGLKTDPFWARNAIARKKLEEHVGFAVKG